MTAFERSPGMRPEAALGKIITFPSVLERDAAAAQIFTEFPELEKGSHLYRRSPWLMVPAMNDVQLGRVREIIGTGAKMFDDKMGFPVGTTSPQ